jgi:hypothetical protein
VLFPTLLFLGLATFVRVNQSTAEDLLLARGINRIRHFYLEYVPDATPYFILGAHDDAEGVLRNMGIRPTAWQLFVTTAGTIGVINSVIAGIIAGLAASLWLGWPLETNAGMGVVIFILGVIAHYGYERESLLRSAQHIEVRFPSPNSADG